MGHDVDIVDAAGSKVTSTSITGNFSCYSNEYGGIHAMHGHRGITVEKICEKAIEKLKSEGIVMPSPGSYPDWGWGVLPTPQGAPLMDFLTGKPDTIWGQAKKARMPEKQHKGVYMYHLRRFLQLGQKYPEFRFVSDQVFVVTPYQDEASGYQSDGGEDETENRDDVEDFSTSPLTFSKCHPNLPPDLLGPPKGLAFFYNNTENDWQTVTRISGEMITVKDFTTAMHAYTEVLRVNSPEQAERWRHLALYYKNR